MPRPRKFRRVCGMPPRPAFGPLRHGPHHHREEAVVMTVDEYETVRLIDYEGLNQEECAQRLDVARTTAQRIYDLARRKLADCLVNGKVLLIEGGDYIVCEGGECPRAHGHGHGCRHHGCEGHHPHHGPPRRHPPAE